MTTTTVGTLPLRTGLVDGESVDSWIEELARRHRMTPRPLLTALGVTHTWLSTRTLVERIDPASWRRIERASGLAQGRLNSAVGDSVPGVTRLWSGGSRYCPDCLVDSGGRWQLSWRLNWTVACPRHRVLLHDTCPTCHGAQRRIIPAGAHPIPPATCTHFTEPNRRCGADLSAAPAIPTPDGVLDVQRWIDTLVTGLGGGDHTAADTVHDLPIVVSWLLRHDHAAFVAAADTLHPDRDARPAVRPRRPGTDAALTAAVLTRAQTILAGDDAAAVTTLRGVLTRTSSPQRIPPAGTTVAQWQSMRSRFPSRYLRAVDTDLHATDRLRMKTMTVRAERPVTDVTTRARSVPQMLWPDWGGRLLPVTGHHPELLRAALAVCLLVPGHRDRDPVRSAARLLNLRIRGGHINALFQGFAAQPDGSVLDAVLSLLCGLAEHLDACGSPIDYQRRRELVPTATIDWPRWRELSCAAGAHPGEHRPHGRLLHAQRYLHQLLSGADLADPRHPLAFHNPQDHDSYVGFTTSLTTPLRRALHDHAANVLAELGIDEPLTWSPPAELARGLTLPGRDLDDLDLDTIAHVVIEQRRPPREAAQLLGVHVEHIRLASEHLERPPRQWAKQTTPSAWRRQRHAEEVLTPEFFEREYVQAGRTLADIADATGLHRGILARFAKQAGITLTSGKAPFPIDRDWLRDQYITRRRSTADIAAELGTGQMTVNLALHRMNIEPRPVGVASFPELLTVLDEDTPTDIRSAVEGRLHGWQRLHRFRIAMMFPNLVTAADYLDVDQATLVTQFRRLERDIGTTLFERSANRMPQQPTPRGQDLLRDLQNPRVQHLMNRGLRDDHTHPAPDTAALAAAHRRFTRPRRKPAPPKPVHDNAVQRLRITRAVLILLRDLLGHPEHFYGHESIQRTGLGAGTVYPALKRLQRAGWLTSHPEDEQAWLAGAPPGRGPGRRRTYYTLTPDGRRAAATELTHTTPRKAHTHENPGPHSRRGNP